MNNNEFYLKQQAAVQRMREMSSQAKIKNDTVQKKPIQTQVPTPHSNNIVNDFTPKAQSSAHSGTPLSTAEQTKKEPKPYQNKLNIPFLDSLFRDGDSTIIIGLLLILLSEKSDKMLLYALIYILL